MPAFVETPLDGCRRSRDLDAEGLEQIGAAAAARGAPVAMFGHPYARRRQHQCGHGGDVERVRSVSPGAARVEYRIERTTQLHRARPHRPREPDDFRRTLPFHREADQEAGHLRRLRPAIHDGLHRVSRLIDRQVDPPLELVDQAGEHSSSRKLRRILRPSPVRTDSGWNCTPCTGHER